MKKYSFAALACLAVYWLSNSILWIPWKYSAWLGAVCMIIYVPIAWGGISAICLQKFDIKERTRAKYFLGILFAVIAIISDLIFYVGYRNIPQQLFKPATFGAYILCFLVPIIVGLIYKKKRNIIKKELLPRHFIIAGACAVVFICTTFYVVKFW